MFASYEGCVREMVVSKCLGGEMFVSNFSKKFQAFFRSVRNIPRASLSPTD
jgi:hypothetical protein